MPQGPSYWFDVRIYLAVAAALLAIIVFYNYYLAVLGAILLTALYFYGRERYRDQRRALNDFLDDMAYNLCEMNNFALRNLPVAMALVDGSGKLTWCNDNFVQWTKGRAAAGASMSQVWPKLPLAEILGRQGQYVLHDGDEHYLIVYRHITGGNTADMTALFVSDITETEEIKAECRALQPVIAYIQIDNYGDVLQGLNESQRAAVLFEVNKILTDWVHSLDGFIKKYAEDTYVAVLSQQALDGAKADNFDILDKIRTIQVGNKIPVTLSMGLASEDASFLVLSEKAQSGLDLALGRGGDQAAVYLGGRYQFYGGKTKAVEKFTRVKARVVAHAVRDSINDADVVLIMGHSNEDFDSLGASLGIARMARHLGKAAYIIVSGEDITAAKIIDLAAEYPEYKDIFVDFPKVAELITSKTLLFLVDTHRPQMAADPAVLDVVDRVIVIDHHRRGQDFVANPLLVYLEPSSSSASELVTELIMYFDNKLTLSRLDATALYAGIVVDTKNFAVQAGVRTFDAAAYLRRAGADPALVRHLFRVDFESVKMRAEIINECEMLPGGIVIAVCPEHVKNNQVISAQAADMLLKVEGVNMVYVLFPVEDGVGVSARCEDDFNVQVIMEQLGGGGHQTVAGAQLKNVSVAEARQKIIELSGKYIEESGKQ